MNKGMKALKKAAPEVAKKMGYNYGGMAKKKDMMGMGMAYGGMAKKKPVKMNKGGMCGASNPAERPVKMSK
jgi:hypothetical protein